MTIEETAVTALYLDNNGQSQRARELYADLLNSVKNKPSSLKDVKDKSFIGKAFLFMFDQNITNSQDDLQLIAEMAYYYTSQTMEKGGSVKPEYLFDRLIILFNAEDFLKDIIKKVYGLKVELLSSVNSPRMIEHRAKDILHKMRFADLAHELRVYQNNDFLREKKEELDEMIEDEYFGRNKSKSEIISEGKIAHEKVLKYLEERLRP